MTGSDWPRVGIAIPTLNDSVAVSACVSAFRDTYPGPIEFSVAANALDPEHGDRLARLGVRVLPFAENYGYGQAANAALADLSAIGCDLYAVSNDDVLPAKACLQELVGCFRRQQSAGRNPGLVGPVSNRVSGLQNVAVPGHLSPEQVLAGADLALAGRQGTDRAHPQLRGLFLLIAPELLEAIGGFDPLFGIGNYEDDDYNVRAKLAGFSLWMAEAAFLWHRGQATFDRLDMDYAYHHEQMKARFLRKWQVRRVEAAFDLAAPPPGVTLHVPLVAVPVPPPERAPEGSSLPVWPRGVRPSSVGRNEPCPCGSGKKYKVCHYPQLRQQGSI